MVRMCLAQAWLTSLAMTLMDRGHFSDRAHAIRAQRDTYVVLSACWCGVPHGMCIVTAGATPLSANLRQMQHAVREKGKLSPLSF